MTQYTVVVVNLDPTVGREIRKTRPCLIISPNEMNEVLDTVIIAPITSNPRKYVTRVKISQEKFKGMIVLDQIRTIDKSRIKDELGELRTKSKLEVKSVLQEMFIK